jgi:hypothetical protein
MSPEVARRYRKRAESVLANHGTWKTVKKMARRHGEYERDIGRPDAPSPEEVEEWLTESKDWFSIEQARRVREEDAARF